MLSIKYLTFVISVLCSAIASAGISKGALAWYRGALDAAGDMQVKSAGEYPNALLQGSSSSWTHKFVSSTAPTLAGNVKICESEVIHPFTGKSLGQRQCLRFEQPVDSDGKVCPHLLILSQSAYYFPTNSVGWTVFMRYKQDVGPLYDEAGDSDPQCLLNFFDYASSGGSGLKLMTKGSPTNSWYTATFGNTELTSARSAMQGKAQYNLKTNCWADVVVSICGTAVDIYYVREGGVIGHTAAKYTLAQDFSKNGTQIRIGGYQPSSTPVVKTDGKASTFRGLVHDFAFWNRKLSDDEVSELLLYSGNDMVNVGVVNNSSLEFIGSGSTVVERTSATDWSAASPNLKAGESLKLKFHLSATEATLGEWFRFAATDSSAESQLAVSVNGTAVKPLAVRAGRTSRTFIPAACFVEGENTLVACASDTLIGEICLDAAAVGGSWQLGIEDESASEAAGNNGTREFLVGDSDLKNRLKSNLLCGDGVTGTNVTFRFIIPDDAYDASKFVRFYAKATCDIGSKWASLRTNQTIVALVNGVKQGDFVLAQSGWNVLKLDISMTAFAAGENSLELQNATPGTWYEPLSKAYMYTVFDFYRLEAIKDLRGSEIIFR